MSSNYFVQLTESGQTVNLAQIASVSWHEVPDGWEESSCEATITLSNGCYTCITPNDAQELWEALNRYNTRMGHFLAALPQLVRALSQFLEELGQVAGSESVEQHEREPSQPRPTAPQPPPAEPKPSGQHGDGSGNGGKVRAGINKSSHPNRERAELNSAMVSRS